MTDSSKYREAVDEIEALDREHSQFIAAVDKLRDVDSLERLLDLVDYLDLYARNHFEREERLMEKAAYPEMNKHVEMHKGFVEWLRRLAADTHKAGGEAMNQRVIDDMLAWVHSHFGDADVRMRKYLVTFFDK